MVKTKENKTAFKNGIRDGLPIALGYFAVAFSLGFVASKVGMTPFQGFLSSLLNHASAGEYAEFTVISANSAYIGMAAVILVTNARYLLMSCALSQKFETDAPLRHRLLVGFGITDEIFGITIARPGSLNPYYSYGAILIALPSWAAGTAIGIAVGNILPQSLVSALSVALYAMFLAVIVPPARKNHVILGVVLISFALSFVCANVELIARLSESTRIIILTVVISAAAALLFPVKDDEDGNTQERAEEDSNDA